MYRESRIDEPSFALHNTVFGSPLDITLHELAMEIFFLADEFTRNVLMFCLRLRLPRPERRAVNPA